MPLRTCEEHPLADVSCAKAAKDDELQLPRLQVPELLRRNRTGNQEKRQAEIQLGRLKRSWRRVADFSRGSK
jgi:hypothetical protein